MTAIDDAAFMTAAEAAWDVGVRLDRVRGLGVWSFSGSPLQGMTAARIARSLRSTPASGDGCGAFAYQGMAVRFPDGSILQPDVAVYAREPEKTNLPTTLVPEAIIEIVSPSSELKDLRYSPSFTLSQGVKDVIVVTPETEVLEHFRRDGRTMHRSPVDLRLECGCLVTV